MLFHLPLPFLDRQLVPVLLLASAAVHRIKAEIARGRNLRIEAAVHGLPLAVHSLFHHGVPFRRVRFSALVPQVAVHLDGRFIQAQLYYRKIGSGLLQEIAQAQSGKLQLRRFELLEGVAEVQQQQVAFMAKK